jgi:hypothetical protein
MLHSPDTHNAATSAYAKVNKCRPGPLDEYRPEAPHINYLIQRNWFEVRDKLRALYPQLTPDDVEYEPGRKEAMMRAIEAKLEISPAKLQQIISSL